MEEEVSPTRAEGSRINRTAAELLARWSLQKDSSLRLLSPATSRPSQPTVLITDSEDLTERFTSYSPPTEFTLMALARRLSLEFHAYSSHLDWSPRQISRHCDAVAEPVNEPPSETSPLINLGLNCLASVLEDLHESDLRICSQALASLRNFLGALPIAGLVEQDPTLADKLLMGLLTIAMSPSDEIASFAGTIAVSLVLASGNPIHFSRAALHFLRSGKLDTSAGFAERTEILLPPSYTQVFLSQVAFSIHLTEQDNLPSWSSISLKDCQTFIDFEIQQPPTLSPDSESDPCGSIASDGEYLYILNAAGLFKIGTGFGMTECGLQCSWNAEMKASPGTWLAFCRGSLYLRRERSSRVWVLDKETLRETGEILLPTETVPGKLCSDGSGFFMFKATEKGFLEAYSVQDNFTPSPSPLLQLKLSKRTHECHGEELVVSRIRSLEPWLAEACGEIQLSRKAALLLTTQGEAYECCGLQGESPVWVKCPVADPIVRISVSPEGHHSLILTNTGELWYNGIGLQPDNHGTFPAASGQSIRFSRPRKVTAPNQKRIISCATSSSVLSIVTENGRVYSFGKNSSHTHPETGQVLHLDHVQIAELDLGKTHAVALSKHGNVYTWGLNNLFQCGRTESLKARSSPGIEGGESDIGSVPLCPPSEHVWLKDVATVCTTCGLCSAHGARCSARINSPARGQTLPCGPGEAGCLRCGVCRRCGERSSPGSSMRDTDVESCDSGDRSQRLVLNPAKLSLPLPRDTKISSVACGNYHSVLLSFDGKVITFGSNCHGQLGVGDTRRRVGPQSLDVPGNSQVVQIAAGANHCVLRNKLGSVITFGSNKSGQLCREGSSPLWQAKPGYVTLKIAEQVATAEWVGAFGDSTVIRMEERLFAPSLDGVTFTGNSLNFSLFQSSSFSSGTGRYAIIDRNKESLTSFHLDDAKKGSLAYSSWTLDPQYDVLWRYCASTKHVDGLSNLPLSFNAKNSFSQDPAILNDHRFWLPWASAEPKLSTLQLGLSLVATLYTNANLNGAYEDSQKADHSTSRLEPISAVSRFKSFGGGWGYSAQSVEAVQFQPSQNIEVMGLGLFGGRGEYSARVKLLRLIGDDYDEQNVELLAEVEETLFESLPRERAQICFLKPVLCYGGQTYLAWAQISGPSSDCGAGGQAVVSGDDGVVFKFRNSRLSNNGTDVHVGQIPSILYRALQKVDKEVNSAKSQIIRPWPLQPSASFIKDLFAILIWALTSMSEAKNQNADWLLEPTSTLSLMIIRLLRIYYSATLANSSDNSLLVFTKSSLADAYRIGEELGSAASEVMEEIVKFEVSYFDQLNSSLESVQMQLSLILKNKNRSSWALIGLTESIAINGWGFPLLILSELGQAGDVRRPKRSQSSFPHFLRFFIEGSLAKEKEAQSQRLEQASALLLGEIAKDLIFAGNSTPHLPVQCSPSRFQRLSSQPGWESGAGAPDALGFRVDAAGITVHGAAIYMGSNGGLMYTLEILVDQGDGFRESWHVLEKISGNLRLVEGGSRENGFVCFHKPIKLLPNVSYALRLHLQGGKTWSGEGGVPTLRLTNGARLSFVSTSLSINGTTVSRGQIPSILYSTARENAYFKAARAKLASHDTSRWFLLLLRSFSDRLHDMLNIKEPVFSMKALSQLFGWTSVFLGLHPEKALDVLGAIDELLPVIASINAHRKHDGFRSGEPEKASAISESQHPYKSGTVSSSVIRFDGNVDYMCLEFDHRSSTAQHEDWVSVYWARQERNEYYLLGRYGGIWGWPSKTIIVPGNSVWFLLESASLRASVAEEKLYGYRCTVTAFSPGKDDPLNRVERELVWLASFAAKHLMSESKINRRDNFDETEIQDLIRHNGSILRKGLSLSHCPSIRELLADSFPTRKVPPELRFLNDFITGSKNTAAGRLGRWFWQKPFIDLEACDVCLSPGDPKCGESTNISLLLKDQFERPATAAGLEIKAITWLGKEPAASPEMDNFLSLFKDSYQPTYLNKARYIAITMMPTYQDYSLEELRLAYFKDTVMKEVIGLHLEDDGRFSGKWIPKQSGNYVLEVKIDGFRLPQTLNITVGDGSRPLKAARHQVCQLSRVRTATVSENMITKAVRIRIAPSTSSRQLGLIPRGSTVSYVDELDNKEGTWLRLSDESTMLYSQIQLPTQAWTLLHSKALDRNLLLRDSEVEDCSVPGMAASIMVSAEETYQVVDPEAAIRDSPTLSQAPFQSLDIGAIINSNAWLHNRDGVWIKLDPSSTKEYTDGKDGFCLAQTAGGKVYLSKNTTTLSGIPSKDAEPSTSAIPLIEISLNSNSSKMITSKPTAHVWPRPSAKKGARCLPIVATSPSAADCIRSVFAALLWHEGLVHDAIACAAFLKFHPELNRPFPSPPDEPPSSVPSSLQMLAQVWEEIVLEINVNSLRTSTVQSSQVKRELSKENSIENPDETLQFCDLCQGWFSTQVATHMRLAHPGCGSHAGGRGYNSMGRYTTGWTGNCGDGGRGAATWYLLCAMCRRRYKSARNRCNPSQAQEESKCIAQKETAIATIKKNAMFLLEVNAEMDIRADVRDFGSGWTVNLFPSQNAQSSSLGSPSSTVAAIKSKSHASDPGPKLETWNFVKIEAVSSCGAEGVSCGEVFMTSPSVGLKAIVNSKGSRKTTVESTVINFVTKFQDLNRIKEVMRLSVRRSTALTHCFRVWTWLLRLVSGEECVMDILWHFLDCLSEFGFKDESPCPSGSQPSMHLLKHPLRLCIFAGSCSHKLLKHFHSFLYTIALILQSQNVNPALQRLCFQSWMFELTPHEQELISGSHLLSCVGRIMSMQPSSLVSSLQETLQTDQSDLQDLTSDLVLETSSRPAMAVCLTDGSTETFWESGEEDRGRSKCIYVKFKASDIYLISIYIDNYRDEGHSVASLTIYALQDSSVSRRVKLHRIGVGSEFCGWLSFWVQGQTYIALELRGPEPCLRVRQVCACGRSGSLQKLPDSHLYTLFEVVQADAFAVLRAVTTQAFSYELSQADTHKDLRQQVFDMLFSRNQLQSLRGYVCAQIVLALEKEVNLLGSGSKGNLSYCSGLLGMLTRISSAPDAINLLECYSSTLPALSELLLFSGPSLQTQAAETITRLATVTNPFSIDRKTFITNLLAVIAKSATIQAKDKVRRTVHPMTIKSALSDPPQSWWLEEGCSPVIGRAVWSLLVNMASGLSGVAWRDAVREEVAFHISYLQTTLTADADLLSWLDNRRIWLALAAMAVLRQEEWLGRREDSAVRSPIIYCENHEDGLTLASTWCQVCGSSLCTACHSVLHLSKKNRSHPVQPLNVEAGRAKVQIHESTTRLKFAGFLILMDGAMLHGMIETIGTAVIAKTCRFCQNPTESGVEEVCSHPDCQAFLATACSKIHPCGHICGGVAEEETCLPCLRCKKDSGLVQDSQDFCVICFTETLGGAPAIQLSSCGHCFHHHCTRATLTKRWSGPRVFFAFMKCPICQKLMDHPSLKDLLDPLRELFQEVSKKAQLRLEYDNLINSPALTDRAYPGGYYNNPEGFAMERYVYVLCSKCGQAYFGGEAVCQEALASSQYDPAELLCGGCSDISGTEICPRHGSSFLEYKCRYCCSVAVFFCFGTTHFCTGCHDEFQKIVSIPKERLPPCPAGPRGVELEGTDCPLRVQHPPTGEEFALGCGVCRNLRTF